MNGNLELACEGCEEDVPQPDVVWHNKRPWHQACLREAIKRAAEDRARRNRLRTG